ncbi:MAG: helix-turn-helix transcriptional regulator [Alphaproteobacteria bacterium]|nr:helix-turn-helix transcriptional regulator [Alphaproteobacteria bacterium]MCB9792001.1 helix-turn-helix transcriptional regulator [Alphaproteobacteria bacterium]
MPDTRDRILNAAEALLSESPEGALPTVPALCARAEVSRASFYRRFGDKDGLLRALSEERGLSLEPPEGARQRALDAACEVFVAEGFGASMERIAEVAGIGPATLYRHFGDKDGLLRAFVQERSPGPELDALRLAGGKDPRADLEQVAEILLRFFARNHGVLRLSLSPEWARLRAAMNTRTHSTRDRLRALLAAHVEAGRLRGDPELLMRSFVGLIVAHGAFGLITGGPPPGPEAAAHIADFFYEGARAR